MRQQLQAIGAEFLKNKHSKIIWITFVAFSLAPVFGGVFMYLMKDSGLEGLSGAFKAKAQLMSFEANWTSFLGLLSQAVGIGGILIFGFTASWLFGREYSDRTGKDLLALPISRTKILNAKFVYYIIWCFALVISNLILGLILAGILGLPGWDMNVFMKNLELYFITTLLVILINTPVAFLAIYGKGYLAPLGLMALLLVLAQIIAAMGFGNYFPWSVPGIYSGSGGEDMKAALDFWSFAIIGIVSILGYFATIYWWSKKDQDN